LVIVNDRRDGRPVNLDGTPRRLLKILIVVPSFGRGPAAARNVGWRAAQSEWIEFLDDDVVVSADWLHALATDLADAAPDVAAVQGKIEVPLPSDRKPTDFERCTSGLATAKWITADMAYRRSALAEVGGFDERFRRAYREDSDLALRLQGRNYRLMHGKRRTAHPVRPADFWVSVRQQRGNADDALMRRLHGRGWRSQAGAPAGRLASHAAVTSLAALTAALALLGRRRTCMVAAGLALAGVSEFAARRIAAGPRTPVEIARMLASSALIPPAALAFRLAGEWRHRSAQPLAPVRPEAVLFDRDGTLIVDVPYNGDPSRVQPVPGARRALDRLRAEGIRIGVITNQSGIGSKLFTPAQLSEVNSRVEQLLGPIDTWQICTHRRIDGCSCRKPKPGMVYAAAAELSLRPEQCVVVGDIGADMAAAAAAGARSILVPAPATRHEEIAQAPERCMDLLEAVDRILEGVRPCDT
jgi:HAD superfamily hydrolase (TIGR01662 family)